jgi:glycosyltransferase involved in cell wall biosynthesis
MRDTPYTVHELDASGPVLLRIVIPAKNEATRIEQTVVACCEFFGARARVLVVLNGCSDATAEVVRTLQMRYPALDAIEIPTPIGKGGAVRAGLTLGDEPFVAFADADGSAAARQIELLLERCAEDGVAGAIGSRWIAGATIGRKQTLQRRLASRAFNLAVRGLFGLRFSDTQCGAKVFRRDAIEHVFHDLEIANFAFDVDVLFALRRAGRRVVEVPIVWADVPGDSKVRLLRAGASMLAALLRLRVKHSPLRLLPFVGRLARSTTIPVKPGLEVLVLVDRAAYFSLPASTYAVLREMTERGHRITTRSLRGASDVAQFHAWYVRHAHLHFDLIVDGTRGTSLPFLRFSSKPRIARAALERLSAQAQREALDSMARACGYTAFLWRNEQEWVVSGAGSSPQHTVLRTLSQR